jgi:hypothetical protein
VSLFDSFLIRRQIVIRFGASSPISAGCRCPNPLAAYGNMSRRSIPSLQFVDDAMSEKIRRRGLLVSVPILVERRRRSSTRDWARFELLRKTAAAIVKGATALLNLHCVRALLRGIWTARPRRGETASPSRRTAWQRPHSNQKPARYPGRTADWVS